MQRETPVIEAILKEERAFPPPEEFRAQAKVTDDSLHREAEADASIVEELQRRSLENAGKEE